MKTKIIAEIGSNWKSIDDIKKSVDYARSVGAIAKGQLWSTKHFIDRKRNPRVYEICKQYEVPRNWIDRLSEYCGSDLFWTIFDENTFSWLMSEGQFFSHYKIASLDSNQRWLFDIVARMNKPTMVSCGVYGLESIRQAVKWFSESGNIFNLTLMHCVVDYPTKDAQLGYFKDRVNGSRHISWGFSYNGNDPVVPALAVACGAEVVECHMKIRDMDTPDSPHSMDKRTFKSMIDNIKIAEENLGNSERPLDCEKLHIKLGSRKSNRKR